MGQGGTIHHMQKQIVKVRNLKDYDEIKDNLEYWLSRPPAERVDAVDHLRNQIHGHPVRLQRIARIIQLSQS